MTGMFKDNRNFLVTGGAGFIGSHMVDLLITKGHQVIVYDKLTYAGKSENLSNALKHKSAELIVGDICDENQVLRLLKKYNIDCLMNFAAETHVDNSITKPRGFLETNFIGTYSLLTATQKYIDASKKSSFRFIQISTDEVYGDLSLEEEKFNENSQYKPNSPYAASKASSDHLVRSWWKTYKLPAVITRCSNNFGPRQNSEKYIPTIILNAITGNPIPIYGDGKNIRDWLFVGDHCDGIFRAYQRGVVGEVYNFGGNKEIANIDLAQKICTLLDKIQPSKKNRRYQDQIQFIEDRPGHDRRYAVSFDKAHKNIGFTPSKDFDSNLFETVNYYINHSEKLHEAIKNISF